MKDPHRRSDLFIHDTTTLQGDILLHEGLSHLRFQEYAVFAKDSDGGSTGQSGDTDNDRPFLKHIPQCIISADGQGDALFHQALKDDYAVDVNGGWDQKASSARLLQGRVRQVICHRRPNIKSSEDLDLDGLHLTDHDFAAMDLHPATLQYVRRRAVESMFWDRHHRKLSIVLSFPTDPCAPYDFLSMTYNVAQRTTTTLVRQSLDPARHSPDDLAQYDVRMQACRFHWAHPLLVPVVLLQEQFARTERAVAENHSEVLAVERDVSNMAGFDAIDERARLRELGGAATPPPVTPARRRGSGHSRAGSTSHSQRGGGGQQPVPKKSTELMKNAHDVLKKAIRLLNTLEWIERVIGILLNAGDALDDVRQTSDAATPSSAAFPPTLASRGRIGTGLLRDRIAEDPLAGHWHEIKQYLEGLLQLCRSLKTDREILEMRCKALVDIVSVLSAKESTRSTEAKSLQIYSKLAQEDNSLNARMAVASSRDSSSMKALAVITAVFLPGEFMSSLFGMGIFNWPGNDDSDGGGNDPVVGYDFWWYWATTIPLTIIILVLWRAWWVWQDRYFRKHLSKDLSEERYWTDDRRPRELETSFLYDFLYLSVRKGEAASEPGPAMSYSPTTGSNTSDDATGLKWIGNRGKQGSGLTSPPTFRLRPVATDEIRSSDHRNGLV